MTNTSSNWTNVSVVDFASGLDPIEKMKQEAQKTILCALDQGWSGPPFDPIELAKILAIEVRPNPALADARVFLVDGRYQIEYNPHRPRGRVNFSIAHEIAHTFFPDCQKEIRNRSRKKWDRTNWELELLCNFGAAEMLMPVGSFPSESEVKTIEDLMLIRKEYQVSAEAVLIRFVKLSSSKIACFSATRLQKFGETTKYRLDYRIASSIWKQTFNRDDLQHFNSRVLDECVAIGTTSKGDERWGTNSKRVHIEAVALPPFPGSDNLRLTGFVRPVSEESNLKDIDYRQGNASLFVTKSSVAILHIVNDDALRWGPRGFAGALRKEQPIAFDDYVHWGQTRPTEKALGSVHMASLTNNQYVVSLIAQEGYGRSLSPRIRYWALDKALRNATKKLIQAKVKTVQMPKIGTGQARGNWEVIEGMIRETLVASGFEVRVIELPP